MPVFAQHSVPAAFLPPQRQAAVPSQGLGFMPANFQPHLQSNNQIVTGVLTANGDVYTSRVQANTKVVTTEIQANTTINTAAISATTGIYANLLQANSSVNTANASVVYTVYANKLQANSSVNTGNASITGTVYTDKLVANTQITVPNLSVTSNALVNQDMHVANASFATDSYVTNGMFTDLLYANTVYIQNNLITVGNTNSASFFATSNVTSPTVYSVDTYGDYLHANTKAYVSAIDVEGTTLTRFLQANSSTNTSNSS